MLPKSNAATSKDAEVCMRARTCVYMHMWLCLVSILSAEWEYLKAREAIKTKVRVVGGCVCESVCARACV